MIKALRMDLKIAMSFAISTAIFLILGFYILLSTQPIIDQFKVTILETAESIDITARLSNIAKEASSNFNNYILKLEPSFYNDYIKNMHQFSVVLEHAQALDNDSISLKVLHKNLPQILSLTTEYKEVSQNSYEFIELFQQNIPKLTFALRELINDMKKFLKTLEEFVRNTGGKDAEAFKLIIEINKMVETALLTRGDFWRGLRAKNPNAFEVCLKTLKTSISHMEMIKKENTVKDFDSNLESFLFSMKNLENIFLATMSIYNSIKENVHAHDIIIQNISKLLNEITEINVSKINTETYHAEASIKTIRNIAIAIIAIGIIFSNTIGFIVARNACKNITN